MNVRQSVGAIVEAVAELVAYARQKALYEADCRVRDELERMRRVMYARDTMQCRMATIELARCKAKIERLRKEISNVPKSLKDLFEPLLAELELRVSAFRKVRQEHSVNSRA